MMTNNSVGTNELVNESVTAAKLADFAITSSELASNSVTTVKIATDAVTNAKIADNSISTSKIQNGAVTPDKLSTSASSGFGFVPVGAVFWFGSNSAPTGYIKCNGDSIPNSTGTVQGVTANFSALYAIVGANVPDLRGEFVRGYDHGRGVDSGRNMLEAQSSQFGQHNHNVSASSSSSVSDPGHQHSMSVGFFNSLSSGGALAFRDAGTSNRINTATTGISVSTSTSVSIGNQGGSEARPRSIAMMYIIKV